MIHIEKELFELQDSILKITEWEKEYNIFAGFSTKNGGISTGDFSALNLSYSVGDDAKSVLENRKRVAALTPVMYDKWIFAQQMHTNTIKAVTKADCGRGAFDFDSGITATDGLYTTEKGIMLATFHADCAPIYFYAPKHEVIGLVHAGWQGTIKEITKNLIKTWNKLGIKSQDIQMIIGPSASQSAYEVGTDVVEQLLQMETEMARDAIIDLGNGKFKLDTAYLNYLVAVEQGIPEEQIIISSYCTICDKDLFFSYRRKKQTGRMLAFISQ